MRINEWRWLILIPEGVIIFWTWRPNICSKRRFKLILNFQHIYHNVNRVARVIVYYASSLASCILLISEFPTWHADMTKLNLWVGLIKYYFKKKLVSSSNIKYCDFLLFVWFCISQLLFVRCAWFDKFYYSCIIVLDKILKICLTYMDRILTHNIFSRKIINYFSHYQFGSPKRTLWIVIFIKQHLKFKKYIYYMSIMLLRLFKNIIWKIKTSILKRNLQCQGHNSFGPISKNIPFSPQRNSKSKSYSA